MTTIALFGAAGKMGTRISTTLKGESDYKLLYVEGTEPGIKKLAERGDKATLADEAIAQADVVILAVPDILIGRVAGEVAPKVKPGTLVMCLDPAAPLGGKLPKRDDISYFVAHPCHPPVFNDETDPEARKDFFGSGKAKQSIVCALMQGPDEDYAKGETLAKKMWGPVLRMHRVTVEEMALLEPVMAETVSATCLTAIREAMDEAIRRGAPAEAARDFIMGHMGIELAVLFDELPGVEFSDGCKKAIAEAKKDIFQADWLKVFDKDKIMESIAKITGDSK